MPNQAVVYVLKLHPKQRGEGKAFLSQRRFILSGLITIPTGISKAVFLAKGLDRKVILTVMCITDPFNISVLAQRRATATHGVLSLPVGALLEHLSGISTPLLVG